MNLRTNVIAIAINEIKGWFSNNQTSDFKLVSLDSNKMTISLSYNQNDHIIQIEYPRKYPEVKNGYVISEVSAPNVTKFKFVQDAHNQCLKKHVGIQKILSHLLALFNKYKIKNSKNGTLLVPSPQKNTETLIQSKKIKHKKNVSEIESNDWLDEETKINVLIKSDPIQEDIVFEDVLHEKAPASYNIFNESSPVQTKSMDTTLIEMNNLSADEMINLIPVQKNEKSIEETMIDQIMKFSTNGIVDEKNASELHKKIVADMHGDRILVVLQQDDIHEKNSFCEEIIVDVYEEAVNKQQDNIITEIIDNLQQDDVHEKNSFCEEIIVDVYEEAVNKQQDIIIVDIIDNLQQDDVIDNLRQDDDIDNLQQDDVIVDDIDNLQQDDDIDNLQQDDVVDNPQLPIEIIDNLRRESMTEDFYASIIVASDHLEELSMAEDLLNKLHGILPDDEFAVENNVPDNISDDDEEIEMKMVCSDDYLYVDGKIIDSPVKILKVPTRTKPIRCDISKKIPSYYDNQDHYGLNLASYMPPFFPFNVNQVMNASRNKYISNSEMCMNIVLNELKQIFQLESYHHFALLPTDTIFDLQLSFKGHNVTVNIYLDNMTYPFTPPKIVCEETEIDAKLAELDILSANVWQPTNGIYDVIVAVGRILGLII
uniref:Uncharacterized protein n=1 Tax=viral metagenome TaxID=1070528 RepID=A0A6C0CB61_9ZZZZ